MDEAQGNYVVYIIFHPVRGVPIYVGVGRPNRPLAHLGKGSHNRRVRAVSTKYGFLPIVITRTGLSRVESNLTETVLIQAIGRADKGEGPLYNFTDGGDGTLGWIPSQETRQKIGQQNSGRVFSEEHRKKLSRARRGVPKSPAQVELMRERMLGERNHRFGKTWKQSEETKEKKRQALKGRKPKNIRKGWSFTDEQKKRLSQSLQGKPKFRSTEHNAKIGAAISKRLRSDPVIVITDGVVNRRQLARLAIPEGWVRGRTKRQVQ